MAFEIVVRPVVFPNIRPQPPRVLPREDDPTKGQCVIRGNPGQSFDLTYSFSFHASSSSNSEQERTVDVTRVYQKNDDGTINRKNFVDVEIARKIKKRGYNGDDWSPDKDPSADVRPTRYIRWKERYKPAEAQDNIEVRETDQTRTNSEL